ILKSVSNSFSIINDALQDRIMEDNNFWSQAPVLSGDWPVHWKNGFVYDFNTLRLTLRPPVGIYTTRWDGMQIRWPRIVLAETSLDMITLSHADPDISKEVLLGIFRDARGPNVPCTREDGSFNMINSDGSISGTSPSWGFPAFTIYSIYLREQDVQWLSEIYFYLGNYLKWWLDNRRDSEGYLVNRSSWEAGQDDLPRWGWGQRSGGSLIENYRTPELQASMAQAAGIMEFFSNILGKGDEIDFWKSIKEEFIERTQSLWHDNWFYDFDSVLDGWSKQGQYAMQLAPIFANLPQLGIEVTGKRQNEILANYLTDPEEYYTVPPGTPVPAKYFESERRWNSKGWTVSGRYRKPDNRIRLDRVWAPIPYTLIEGAWRIGKRQIAAELSYMLLDPVYKTMDLREKLALKPMPGVSYECWDTALQAPELPVISIESGVEGYGWGAITALFLIREIIGFRENDLDSFILSPTFPDKLLNSGNLFEISNLKFKGGVFNLKYIFSTEKDIEVYLNVKNARWSKIKVVDEGGNEIPVHQTIGKAVFNAINGQVLRVYPIE
ncbi:MAG: hypothetical protein ACE5QV_06620, partial [Fidelibacterota bacterium]